MSDNMLLEAMSIDELSQFKGMYPNNTSIATIIDGYIEVKTKQAAQAKAQEDFGKAIAKMVAKLPHPDDVHNVFLHWAKVNEPIPDAEGEEVTLADGTTEVRLPMHEVWKWGVELNKGFQVGKATTTNGAPTTSKRAITINKRNGQTLVLVGNFSSASKACQHLGINIGGDSAPRVLARDGYILDPYTGTDLIA